VRINVKRGAGGGGYLPNQFLILLDKEHSLLDASGQIVADLTAPSVFVFIHEYIHYLTNVSTASGYLSLAAWQRLVALFSGTLEPSGNCRGSRVLDDAGQMHVAQFLAYSDFHEGDTEPRHLLGCGEDIVDMRVVQASLEPEQLPLPDGPVSRQRVTLTCEATMSDGNKMVVPFHFGATAIEE
jgi:hypothetical protein